ncbi:MAG: hypothetical protein Q4F57_00260 [Weeksellaceae bacterium]|nr:hypothetical protein [Weeksellaceae bacterium]
MLLLFIPVFSLGQKTIQLKDFSPDYTAKVTYTTTGNYEYEGFIRIFNKKTNKMLIEVRNEMLILGNASEIANIAQKPYGEHSLVFYEDFNFDGRKDFAIAEGRAGCYGSESYKIFLGTKQGFKYSQELTDIAEGGCGMFSVDPEDKSIHTFNKSGWFDKFGYSYRYHNNKPYLYEETSIVADGLHETLIIEKFDPKGKSISKEITKYFNDDLMEQLGEIKLQNTFRNNKVMTIYTTSDTLGYSFHNEDYFIELLHEGDFQYSKEDNTLSFINEDTKYIIHEDKIVIETPSKTHTLNAIPGKKIGTLKSIAHYNK